MLAHTAPRGFESHSLRPKPESTDGLWVRGGAGQPHENPTKLPTPLGMRWTVERTNSWLTNYGQLRRNTDRRIHHRLAQLALVIALIITIKLINWRNRWNPTN